MYNKTIDILVDLGFHNLCSLWEYIYDSFPGKIRENILFCLFTPIKCLLKVLQLTKRKIPVSAEFVLM